MNEDTRPRDDAPSSVEIEAASGRKRLATLKHIGIFVAILIVAFAARAATFRGFTGGDDGDYAKVAWAITQGQFPR